MATFDSFFIFELLFFLNHLLFCSYLKSSCKLSPAQLLVHPIQITILFIIITVYIPIKINFIFQHSYLLYEIPRIYFIKVFQLYVAALFLTYIFIILYSQISKSHINLNALKKIDHENDLRISYKFYLLISIFAGLFLILTNAELFFTFNINEFSENIKRGGNNSLFQIFVLITLLPAYFFFSSPHADLHKLLFLILFIVITLILFGARYPLIVVMISFVYFGVAFLQINLKHMIALVCMGIIFFVLISFFRSDSASSSNQLLSLGAYFLRNNDFLYNSALPIYLHDIDEMDLFYGKTFIVDNLKMFQPSALFPDKELSFMPSRFFYGTYATIDGRTFNFGFLGRAYMDFGVAGFFILFILFQSLYHKLFEILIQKKATKSSSYFLIVILMVRYPMFMMIGVNSHIWSLILIDIIAYYAPNFLLKR
jgi:oligosaccharide repeat unit polymerase